MKLVDKLGVNQNEYVNLLLNATVQQYCTLLQLPNYYDNIMEANFYQSTGESSPMVAELNLNSQQKEDNLMSTVKDTNQSIKSKSNQQDMDWENIQSESFSNHNPKKPRIGPQYQVHEIPLLTDIQDFEYLQKLESLMEGLSQPMWDPSKITEEQLSNSNFYQQVYKVQYLKNIEQLWPYDQFHYQEDLALYYLHLKDYDVEYALTSVIYNIDELIKFLIVLKRRKRKDAIFALGQQLKHSRNNGQRQKVFFVKLYIFRTLRERKQGQQQEEEEIRNKNANYLIID